MGGYIPMDKDLALDERVIALADALLEQNLDPLQQRQLMRNAVLGGLFRLWSHCDVYLRRNRLKAASRLLSEVTGLPTSLLDKFPKQWLRFVDNETVEIPGYAEKNHLFDRDHRRELGRRRTRRWRAKLKADGDVTGNKNVTHPRVTKTSPTGPDHRTGPGARRSDRAPLSRPGLRRPALRGPGAAFQSTGDPRQDWEREFKARFVGPPKPKPEH